MRKAALIACTLIFVSAAVLAPQNERLFAARRPVLPKVCGTICQFCNTCDQTGDCFACCRCAGGGAGHCTYICG